MGSRAATLQPTGFFHHPDHRHVAPLLKRYPRQVGPLFHAWADLVHSARWTEMTVIDLASQRPAKKSGSPSRDANRGCGFGALIGRRSQGKKLEAIVPCHVTDMLSVAYFDEVFRALSSKAYSIISADENNPEAEPTFSQSLGVELESEHIILAILSSDSTIVYYKLARGLVKPVN